LCVKKKKNLVAWFAELGMKDITKNSLDAVSDRDFIGKQLVFLLACTGTVVISTCMKLVMPRCVNSVKPQGRLD
jgi:hypothetical protein